MWLPIESDYANKQLLNKMRSAPPPPRSNGSLGRNQRGSFVSFSWLLNKLWASMEEVRKEFCDFLIRCVLWFKVFLSIVHITKHSRWTAFSFFSENIRYFKTKIPSIIGSTQWGKETVIEWQGWGWIVEWAWGWEIAHRKGSNNLTGFGDALEVGTHVDPFVLTPNSC